jgi:hypothetical protein
MQAWCLGYGVVYQLSSQLLASAQSVDGALARGAGHIRLPGTLPVAVTARAQLWHEVLALVALQEQHQQDRVASPVMSLQDVAAHVLDSKVIELVVEVLLTNTRPINITVRGAASLGTAACVLILLLAALFCKR